MRFWPVLPLSACKSTGERRPKWSARGVPGEVHSFLRRRQEQLRLQSSKFQPLRSAALRSSWQLATQGTTIKNEHL